MRLLFMRKLDCVEKNKDIKRLKRSVLKSEELSRRVKGWNSVEEIRRWREKR